MNAIATDAEKLAELDDDTRRAWGSYSERIRKLSGDEYASAEDESWTELQTRLSALARRRRRLIGEPS